MNRIRLHPGTYVAITEVTVMAIHHNQNLDYVTYKAGEHFEIRRLTNGFWDAVVYYPNFGDDPPQFERVGVAVQSAATQEHDV